MKKFLLGAIAAFTLVASPAIAQIPVPVNQWIPTAQGEQGDIFSIDKGSIQTNGSAYGFWVHVDHAQGNIAASQIYMAANCGNDTIQYAWLIQADRSGQIINNGQLNAPAMQAPSGSVNSRLVNAVCTGFSTDPQLAALTRARQTNAELIIKAMETAAKAFR